MRNRFQYLDSDPLPTFEDVLIVPRHGSVRSRGKVTLETHLPFFHQPAIPIVAANMDGVGTFNMADALAQHKMLTCLSKHYKENELLGFFNHGSPELRERRLAHVAVTIGAGDDALMAVSGLFQSDSIPRILCIDVANGHSDLLIDSVKTARRSIGPGVTIIAGNIATPEGVEPLVRAGANIVKVGIGPGSVCTTRIKTGVGFPQIAAVSLCAREAARLGALVISDGGCKNPGDVAKAFAAGASLVMIGGMLAGHTEGGGEVIVKRYRTDEVVFEDGLDVPVIEERRFVRFYGMSSEAANTKHNGGLRGYRTSEGREVLVPFRGPVEGTVQDILGGLRSACSYAGCDNLREFMDVADLVRVTRQYNTVFEK
jgi:GMP reductase